MKNTKSVNELMVSKLTEGTKYDKPSIKFEDLQKEVTDNIVVNVISSKTTPYTDIEYLQLQLGELDDLMQYSHRYRSLKFTKSNIGAISIVDGSIIFFIDCKDKTLKITVGFNTCDESELDNQCIIETTSNYDIEDSVINLPKLIDIIDLNTISMITLFYNDVYLICETTDIKL